MHFRSFIFALLAFSPIAQASFEPWVENLDRCSAIVADSDLKDLADQARRICPAPVIPPITQKVDWASLQKQLQKNAFKTDRTLKPGKSLSEIQADLSLKKSRLRSALDFQTQFLNQLETATSAVASDFLSSSLADPSQHDRLTTE
ncbi:MAG: hypothetical protein EOP09_13420, partial [Proteobacteria bacterium]